MEHELQKLSNENSELISTRDLVDEWFSYLDVSPATLETYQKSMRVFLAFLKKENISRPTRKDLIRFRDEQREKFAPSTVQVRMTAVRLFFQFLEDQHVYPNVASHIKGAKINSSMHRTGYLTSAQCRELLESIDKESVIGRRNYALLSLMIVTGLRTVSIERANIEDLQTMGDQSVLFYQGKGRSDRSEFVLIPHKLEKILRNMLKDRPKAKGKDPLFISYCRRGVGNRLRTVSIRKIIKSVFRDIGLPESLSAHSLRHAAGSIAIANDADLMDVQTMLGHRDISTTMIYVNSHNRLKSQSEKKIADAIFE